ncbi:hypothetical protein ABIA00_002400 [Bradyrhizobium ottawaense]|uniref:hypothetical protein n=1 Tax=Bradyrhizobium ottawaense TaxID=931866 RepID=UPI003834DAC6
MSPITASDLVQKVARLRHKALGRMIGQSVQRRRRPLHHRLDKLPQDIQSFVPPHLQLDGVFRQVRTKLFAVDVGALSEQTARIRREREIAMAAQLGVYFV